MNGDSFTLYPGNWLYNAGVIGFCTVVTDVAEDHPKLISFDKNLLKIDASIFLDSKAFDCYKKYHEPNQPPLYGKAIYRNFMQGEKNKKAAETNIFREFVHELGVLQHNSKIPACTLCGNRYDFQDTASTGVRAFFADRQKLTMRLSSDFGPSEGTFPNAHWNLENTQYVCPLCMYILLHSHIPFTSGSQRMFINGQSFELMLQLNQFVQANLKRDTDHRQLLALGLIEWARKSRGVLGAWSLSNIEMIVKSGKSDIQYFKIPYDISRLLMKKDIADLISQIGEYRVLNLVLNTEFDELLRLTHHGLRRLLTEEDKTGRLSKLYWKSDEQLEKTVRLLPKLYLAIQSHLSKEVMA